MNNIKSTEFMTIGNKRIPVHMEEIDIFDLDYYPQNPRINYVLSQQGGCLDQKTIEKNLWALDSTKELAEDIRRNGGLIEEVLVLDGQVVEGNTRLCAYRHLYRNAPDGQKEKWSKIRAKRLLEKINTKDLFLLLGKLHIQGKTQWDPYEKASYIYKMSDENGMSLKEISNIVGMNESSIKNQIVAYELMRDEYLPKITKLDDKDMEIKKFSIFLEYCRSADLQRIKNKTPHILSNEKFIEWVLEGRIRSAAYDVRKDLANILKCKAARKRFSEEEPVDAIPIAKEILALDRPETGDTFFEKLNQMTKFISKAQVIKIKEQVSESPRMRNMIEKFRREVNKFCRNTLVNNDPSLPTPVRRKKAKRFNN